MTTTAGGGGGAGSGGGDQQQQQQMQQQQQQQIISRTFQRCGEWLLSISIPRDDPIIQQLESTTEYRSFVDAFERLERAHRKVISTTTTTTTPTSSFETHPNRQQEDEIVNSYHSSMPASSSSPILVPSPSHSSSGNDHQVKKRSRTFSGNEGDDDDDDNYDGHDDDNDEQGRDGHQQQPKEKKLDEGHLFTAGTTETSLETCSSSSSTNDCSHNPDVVMVSPSSSIIPSSKSLSSSPNATTTSSSLTSSMAWENSSNAAGSGAGTVVLQQFVRSDDVLLRIFEFLETTSLIRTRAVCSRFQQLADQSATQRTFPLVRQRQLLNTMQLLRVQEQLDGITAEGQATNDNSNSYNNFLMTPVRVPILLLPRRIVISGAGDPEFNGVYHCTDCGANGFVFTKPRQVQRMISTTPLVVPSGTTTTATETEEGGGGSTTTSMSPPRPPQDEEGQQVRNDNQNNQEVGGGPIQQQERGDAMGNERIRPVFHEPLEQRPRNEQDMNDVFHRQWQRLRLRQQHERQQQGQLLDEVFRGDRERHAARLRQLQQLGLVQNDLNNLGAARIPEDNGGQVQRQQQRSTYLSSSRNNHQGPLRCIIQKKFSGSTILWYISKEVLSTTNDNNGNENDLMERRMTVDRQDTTERDAGQQLAGNATTATSGHVTQEVQEVFFYWAPLLFDTSNDDCSYPSTSTNLEAHNDGSTWRTIFATTGANHEPPTVELLDQNSNNE